MLSELDVNDRLLVEDPKSKTLHSSAIYIGGRLVLHKMVVITNNDDNG